MKNKLYLNTFSPSSVEIARCDGYGIEIESYMMANSARSVDDIHLPNLTDIPERILHGSIIHRQPENIAAKRKEELIAIFALHCRLAKTLSASKVVFHCDYFAAIWEKEAWIESRVDLWSRFLNAQTSNPEICLENFIDETPHMLATLIDRIAHPGLGICLDVGHAHCNSAVPVANWIKVLGRRIYHVHLHNNDGINDKHWPITRGTLDMKKTLELIARYASDATITLECDHRESLSWLNENGYLAMPT